MKNNKPVMNGLAALSLAGMIYCFIVYLYIQAELVPALPEPAEALKNLGGSTLLFILLAGVYHIFLLIHALKVLGDKVKTFVHSFYVVMIILSGILLGSDITVLSDIGKEYRLFEVNEQWLILYGCTALHIAVIVYGTVLYRKNRSSSKHLFDELRNGNDAMFLSVFQIGFICGLLGIAGVIFPMSGIMDTVFTERYKAAYMLLLAVLALLPAILFISYWAIRNKNKPVSTWFDEKQSFDAAFSAVFTLAATFPLVVILIIASVCIAGLPASFWLFLLIFIQLAVFAGSVTWRSRLY